MAQPIVLNFGGGRQTVAICVLIAKGVLPRPDMIVMADTGRENQSTWDYLEEHLKPFLSSYDLFVQIAPKSLATVDIYGHNGQLLLPVYTETGKFRAFCSGEWKRSVVDRFLRTHNMTSGIRWIGFGFEERRRWSKLHNTQSGNWIFQCPLVDLMLNTAACLEVIKSVGLPIPRHSSCWMCPHKSNEEWQHLRTHYPEQWLAACELDNELRINDGHHAVFLHHSRQPLEQANLAVNESANVIEQCTLGMCFI
jgi:hypothetical protein